MIGGAVAVALIVSLVPAAAAPPARRAAAATTARAAILSPASRVDALIAQMTLDEKLSLVSGGPEDASTNQYQAGYLPGIPRLGIPSLRLSDGPPGISTKELSTGMTQTMGVAATFSAADARKNGEVIGRDAKALGQDVALEPFINIDRDPASARDWNTFGEDPLLTGILGAATIKGIQSQGIMAQAKHFIGFDGVANGNVLVGDQALHEIYLKPFADAVNAGVSSVMCSYNRVNGEQACGSSALLNQDLKSQLGFTGFVTSDWGASHSADYLSQGLDLEMPGNNTYGGLIPAFLTPTALKAAIAAGTLQVSRVDDAVRRLLTQYQRFGLLDGQQKHTVTPESIKKNAAVVQRTGEDAATLLKNNGNALPLTTSDLASLAMIGPGAGQTMATGGGGEKATGRANRWIGAVQAIEQTTPSARLDYAVGDDMTGTAIPAAALSHNGAPGLLRTTGTTTQVDPQLNFSTAHHNALPVGTSHNWAGTLTAPESGSYWINFGELGTSGSVTIDGTVVIKSDSFVGTPNPRFGTVKAGDAGVLPSTDGLNNKRVQVNLTAGAHTLAVTQTADISAQPVQVELNWVTPTQQLANTAAAITAARHAKTAVVFAWSTGSLASPLPEGQDQLISDIAAVNKNTIVVINTNQPLAMPWLDKVKAVLNMWFPGDEGGWATASVLLGHTNPAGRLPFTWPATIDQGVANDPNHPERSSKGVNPSTLTSCTNTASGVGASPNCDTSYSEGIDVGYRWFDSQGYTPLFPFGYGLSYTKFAYSDLSVTQTKGHQLSVSFTITNTGTVTGQEVPQVYLGAPSNRPAGVQFAPQALAAFDRVTIKAGHSKRITLDVQPRELSYWSTSTQEWQIATGTRTVEVGNSSRGEKLHTKTTISD